MDSKYQEFFDVVPKTVGLTLMTVIPSKFSQLRSDILAYVFVQQGIMKKVVCDNLKECAQRIIKQNLTRVDSNNEALACIDMELSEECKTLLDNFLYFKNRYKDIMNSSLLTTYISYIMITDKSLSCYKFFDDCIYCAEKQNVRDTLHSEIQSSIQNNISETLCNCGQYLTSPLYKRMYDFYGREQEVQDAVNVLARMNKSNLLIVGKPGVGKTSIVAGICNLLQSEDCPELLKKYNVFELNVTKLISGTAFRGDLEQRLDLVIQELERCDNIILFIDEIHNIFNKSTDTESSSIQGALKPYLERGSKVIGCTTESEYKVLEKDSAFERRFSVLHLKELDKDLTVETLNNKLHQYESYYNIKIDKQLLPEIVSLCGTYIKNRYFPDKAFDVLDLSCAICLRNNRCHELSQNDVNEAIYKLSNINPKEKTVQNTFEIEKEIKKCIFGQDVAIESVCKAFRKYYIGVNNKTKPIACFLFVGPTGTGKTELCRQVAQRFFTRESFIRYDMSEFMEQHSVAKLIGAPPGYVGYSSGGSLTEKVKHNPFSLILFDEVEKAHPDVINILLQIMDEGRLTDSFSTTVDFTNTLIVMTSNLGCKQMASTKKLGFGTVDDSYNKQPIQDAVNHFFSPEFRNRLDDIIYFNPITKEVYENIFAKELSIFVSRYKECGIDIDISSEKKNELKTKCFSEKDGVRFIQRTISSSLEDKIAEELVKNRKKITIK